jgi:Ser-tRNA(Ala) deacylase AlaX
MEPMSMETILNSFTKRQRRHVVVPDISRVDWTKCEYLSWMHTSGHMAYVVYNHQKPAIGLVLRRTKLTGA